MLYSVCGMTFGMVIKFPFTFTLFMFAVVFSLSVSAEGQNTPFDVKKFIAPEIEKMPAPQIWEGVNGVEIPISTASEKAREHVKQGFSLVYAQWDIEAYRHFCAAIKSDPDCLMAYCGIALSLAKPYNEFVVYQRAAVSRMLDLMEADKRDELAGKPTHFPELEREFCAAVATLVSSDPRVAVALFQRLSDKYPKFLQAEVLLLFFKRGSYDEYGDPSEAQKLVLERTQKLLKTHPNNSIVLGFWLSLNATAPLDKEHVKKELLPIAKRLVSKNPNVPSWQYMLGHYARKAGESDLAETAFLASIKAYQSWMQSTGASVDDCEGWVKASCYLAHVYYERGDFEKSIQLAKTLRKTPLNAKRPLSKGNAILLWRAYNLPARLYAARGKKGDMNKALQSLPRKKELQAFIEHPKFPTLAGAYINALDFYIKARKAVDANDLSAAQVLRQGVFHKQIAAMEKVKSGVRQMPDFSHYLVACNSLAVYDNELAGLIAIKGRKKSRVVALTRFLAAREKQRQNFAILPPMVPQLMENRLGEYYESIGDLKEALNAYREGEARIPGNHISLQGIKRCEK